MRVGFIYPHWRFNGGNGRLTDALSVIARELTTRLAAMDYHVTLHPPRRFGEPAEEVHDGVRYHRVPVIADRILARLKVVDKVRPRNPLRPFRISTLYYPRYVRRVVEDLRHAGCDVAHLFTVFHFAPLIRSRCPNTKIVLHMQDHSLVERDPSIVAGHLTHVDRIIGCSEHVTGAIREAFPHVAERCITLHNGVDVQMFSPGKPPSGGRPRLLYVGRLSPEKGPHVLLEALSRLPRSQRDLELEVVGPRALAPADFVDPLDRDPLCRPIRLLYRDRKSYARALERAASRLAPGTVAFRGPVHHGDLVGHYRRANIFVFPSVWHEPFGIPVIEAMAAGVPVIASRGGGLPELVDDGTTGLLVQRGGVAHLASAIQHLLDDPARRATMGCAARERAVQRFSWDDLAGRLAEIYDDLSGGPAPAGRPLSHGDVPLRVGAGP